MSFIFLLLNASASAHAENIDQKRLDTVQGLLSIAEHDIDLTRAKVTIDNLVDPAVDIEGTLKRIDGIVAAIETMAGPQANDDKKLAAIRAYIYQSGPWNDHKAFQYDLNDPLGHHIPSKLLAHYLDSKLGNCVSMPFLFIAIADRMGLNVTASTAPHHVYVRYTNVSGKTINLETTSGANPSRNEWIRRNMPMTDMAIQKGAYLKTLTKRETIVVMAMVLIEDAMEDGRYGTVLNLVNILMPHYPNMAELHLSRGSAAYKILETQFHAKYPTPRDIPHQYLGYFQHLQTVNQSSFATAETLGWRPENKIQRLADDILEAASGRRN